MGSEMCIRDRGAEACLVRAPETGSLSHMLQMVGHLPLHELGPVGIDSPRSLPRFGDWNNCGVPPALRRLPCPPGPIAAVKEPVLSCVAKILEEQRSKPVRPFSTFSPFFIFLKADSNSLEVLVHGLHPFIVAPFSALMSSKNLLNLSVRSSFLLCEPMTTDTCILEDRGQLSGDG